MAGFLAALPLIGAGISGLTSLLGFGKSVRDDRTAFNQNLYNMQMQNEWNQKSFDLASRNIDLQKEFAQKGISWRVEDAKSSGIHPLAALGMNPMSFSPVSAGGSAVQSKFRPMGQDLSRVQNSFKSVMDMKIGMLRLEQERARLDNMKLQNVGLAKKLEEMKENEIVDSDGVIIGQNYITETDLMDGSVKRYPSSGPFPKPTGFTYNKTKVPYSNQTGVQAGMDPMYKYSIDPERGHHLVLSDPNEEKLESMNFKQMVMDGVQAKRMLGGLYYKYAPKFMRPAHREKAFREKIRKYAPKKRLPMGFKWLYDPWQDRFIPAKISTKRR